MILCKIVKIKIIFKLSKNINNYNKMLNKYN